MFLGEETAWGDAVTELKTYNIYNQPGQRPVKTTTPIDVPQLYPSMLRRKPIKSSVSVEGSYTFSLPKTNIADFLTLILGDDDGTGGVYALKPYNTNSWTIIQTIGDTRIARYTGMKAQSMTLNITADAVASFDVAFLGKDEEVDTPLNANGDGSSTGWFTFGGAYAAPFALTDGKISGWANNDFRTGLDEFDAAGAAGTDSVFATYDNFVDYFPSWSATLRVQKLGSPNTNVAGSALSTTPIDEDNTIVPFSDLSLTVNNALEFPTYINGTINRNEPVQTSYKEVTGTMTVPFNEFTEKFIEDGIFKQENYIATISFTDPDGGSSAVEFKLPNFCVTGDGGLPDIPEGEVTLPLSFGAYAALDNNDTSFADGNPEGTEAPLVVTVTA